MNTFLVIAAVMAAIAAGAVAFPLLRDRQSRVAGVLAAVVVIGAAAASLSAVVELELACAGAAAGRRGPGCGRHGRQTRKASAGQPDDLAGWLMLGRSYVALNRLDDAVVAYDHAHQLDAKSAEAAMGLGEAMSLRAGGEITAGGLAIVRAGAGAGAG